MTGRKSGSGNKTTKYGVPYQINGIVNPEWKHLEYLAHREERILKARKWEEANKERASLSKSNNARSTKYGLSSIDLYIMLEQQGYKCALCRKWLSIQNKQKNKYHVDHSHADNTVRGLVHPYCNVGLKYIEDKEFLNNALNYIERF